MVLTGAHFSASGATAGGDLRIGGAYQGGQSEPASQLPNAQTLIADGGTTFQANGRNAGARGGHIVLWSDTSTTVGASVAALSGLGGKGGSVEISSGETLQFTGLASAGVGGTVLFDPKDIVVAIVGLSGLPATYGTGSNFLPATIAPSTITAILNTGSAVVLQANNDITITDAIIANNPAATGARSRWRQAAASW